MALEYRWNGKEVYPGDGGGNGSASGSKGGICLNDILYDFFTGQFNAFFIILD